MTKKTYILILFILQYCTVFPQNSSFSEQGKIIIGFNSIEYLLDGELRFKFEKFYRDYHSVSVFASYIGSYSLGNKTNSSFYFSFREGFKTGVGYRFYFTDKLFDFIDFDEKYNRDTYIDFFTFYKYLFLKEVNNGPFFYMKAVPVQLFNEKDHIYSFQIQFGKILRLNKIVLDFYLNGGIRYKYRTKNRIYRCDDYHFDRSINANTFTPCLYSPQRGISENEFYPVLNCGCNIGFFFGTSNGFN